MGSEMDRPKVNGDRHLYPDSENTDRIDNLGNIRGKTLDVYFYLVDNEGKHGVREIQRVLNYNSSSVAAYHLNRLYEHDLVEKTESGKYFIEGDPVKLGALQDHIQIAGLLVPRIVVYGLQAVISIIVGIILYTTEADPLAWLLYVVIVNGGVVIKVIRDAMKISSKLKVPNRQ